MQNINLNNLEFKDIGIWPRPLKIGAIAIISFIAMACTYFLFVSNNLEKLQSQQQHNNDLRQDFQNKHEKAANLKAYTEQMQEMKQTIEQLIKQLPPEGQIPNLMEELTSHATQAGLEFELMQPGAVTDKGFYKELPINITLTGSYHSLGKFISSVSQMSRIVTLHDFTIKANKQPNSHIGSLLTMQVEAKTYWYTNSNLENVKPNKGGNHA
jgi:type IV pilus assembly protein PilO